MNKFLNKKQVEGFIATLVDGSIFSVVFEKKDGTLRRMVCRQGVQKNLAGGEATYNGANGDADNIGVFDTEADGYRCFSAYRVVRMKGGGATMSACAADEIDEPVVNARGEEVKIK